MGFFSSGSGAGGRAARAQQEANDRAIAELRRQFDLTQENFQPFVDAGTDALPGVIEGTTTEGLDARLGRIFDSESFQRLKGERIEDTRGQLSAGGLTRSGTALEEIANVPTDLGFQIEQLLTGRSTQLAGSGQNAVAGLGGLGAQNAGSIAQLFQNSGQARSSGIITDAASGVGNLQGLLNAGGSIFGAASAAGGFGALASTFFSDPRLKENIVKIDEIVLSDGNKLGIYKWDWVETESEILKMCVPYGFLTTEVKELYPQHVLEFGGFEALDYQMLIEDIKAGYKWLH